MFQEVPFCDIYGYICFDDGMTNAPKEWTCDCPMECNSISYLYSIESTQLDPEELCPDSEQKETLDDFLMKPFYENRFPPQYIRNLKKIKDNVGDQTMDYCKRNLQYRSIVKFRLAKDSISVTVMSRRLSFFDKMSSFGKTIRFDI